MSRIPLAPRLSVVWVVLPVLTILGIALTPAPGWPGAQHHFLELAPTGRLEFSANVLLYVPLGLAIGARAASPAAGGLFGFLLSTATELLQFVVPGRDPSASDIVANSFGALLGSAVCLVPGLRGFLRRPMLRIEAIVRLSSTGPDSIARTWVLVWAVVILSMLNLSAVLLLPAIPAGQQYVVRS